MDAAGQLGVAVREGRRRLELLWPVWDYERDLEGQEEKWSVYRQDSLGSWTLDAG